MEDWWWAYRVTKSKAVRAPEIPTKLMETDRGTIELQKTQKMVPKETPKEWGEKAGKAVKETPKILNAIKLVTELEDKALEVPTKPEETAV